MFQPQQPHCTALTELTSKLTLLPLQVTEPTDWPGPGRPYCRGCCRATSIGGEGDGREESRNAEPGMLWCCGRLRGGRGGRHFPCCRDNQCYHVHILGSANLPLSPSPTPGPPGHRGWPLSWRSTCLQVFAPTLI